MTSKLRKKNMEVKNVQQVGDTVYTFTGELNTTEHAVVLSYGLNTLMSLGLMSLMPNVDVSATEANENPTH